MNNKNIVHRCISLILVMSMIIPMIMPSKVYAKDYTVDNWDKYKDELKEGIENQEENITITFKDGMAVVSEPAARFMINNAYEEVKKKLPKYYGELNIKNFGNVIVEIKGTLLNSVKYDKIDYFNNVKSIQEHLENENVYESIKSKTTDYEKIKAAYDYVIDNLDYKGSYDNHDILAGLKTEDKKSVSADAYAMLFAMMMDELGYENDIIIGTIKKTSLRHVWNLVKVQGNWYHVDSRLGEVESDRYKFFLTSDEIMKNSYNHQWKGYEDKSAEKVYDKNNSENAEAEFIARQKLDEAEILLVEVSSDNDMAVNIAVNKAYNIAVEVQDLVNALDNIELKEIIEDFNVVKAAKDKIVIAEKDGGATKENIDTAKNAVNQVSANYANIKKNLENRIKNLEEILKNSEEQEIIDNAIYAVDNAENSIKNIPAEGSLATIIETAESSVKTAETEVKKIKDTIVKQELQNKINAIKLVIAAMKAVVKAETPPYKSANINSARKAIDKIDEVKYVDVRGTLNERLSKVESEIDFVDIVSKAVKAVEKAEKSMKETDVDLARNAVGLIPKEKSDEINKLNIRIRGTDRVIQAEKSLVKYLEEPIDDNKNDLQEKIKEANYRVGQLEDGEIKTKRKDRMKVISNSKTAIEAVEEVKNNGTTEDIEKAKEAIDKVTDSKIKKELEKRLKDIISQKDIEDKGQAAKDAVNKAKESLGNEDTTSADNILIVKDADDAIKNLPTGALKKELQATIKELNNAIKAKQSVENAEVKAENGTLTAKDVTAAEKAILNINPEYKPGLDDKVKALRAKLEEKEAADFLKKAEEAVKKANETKLAKDIAAAKKAIGLIKDDTNIDGVTKQSLTEEIEKLEVSIAENSVKYAEESALHSSKTLSKDITAAKNAVTAISNKGMYGKEISNLNARIRALESYVSTIKILENAEKNRNEINKNAAETALKDFESIVGNVAEEDKVIYVGMISDIGGRINAIKEYLEGVETKVTEAQKAVEKAEAEMKVIEKEDGTKVVLEPDNSLIQDAQNAVNKVTDKKLRASLQKRLDAIQIAKDAKTAITRAMAYPNDKSVKDAETALNKVDGRYSDIIEFLGEEIAKLKNQLDISKKVDEATKLVQKAVESRIAADSIKARFAVDALEELAPDSYDRLIKILDELDESIKNSSDTEKAALDAANTALAKVFEIIDKVNTYIVKIIEGEDGEAEKIQEAYEMIDDAKNQVIKANSAVRKLSNQKDLLAQIDNANKVIDLSEDNIDVKEAVRLVTKASRSVLNAETEEDKSQARLDIAAARRAIDKIGHSSNKDIKKTILDTINSIEKKLTSDNDQELIDLAVKAVNDAADLLAESIRKGRVMDEQEKIDKAIFAAKMAIGWISDDNKAAKDTLTGFLNDIEAMYKAEKAGIENEERIKNAEAAVVAAEEKYKQGSDELESYIRIARLRVKIIINDGPDTKAKIDELNARLDVLEGKGSGGSGGNNGGGSGNGGNNKPGTGGNKPGGSNSPGNKIPTTPLPNSKRNIGVTEPEWGKTKELKKTIPTTGIPTLDASAFKIYESKLKVIELSNILKTSNNANARLVVRGKNITLDVKPYIYDSVNNSILLPIKTIGDELGFSVSLVDGPSTKRLLLNGIVYGQTKSVIMDIGSQYSYINGGLVMLNSKPVIVEGRAYIPVDFMVEYLGLNFSYYNDGVSIQIVIN